jgi:demethylmenaquinone methyltransferase/2-methoxy-6-polyprenyl-1,4-benzoquinol methylase
MQVMANSFYDPGEHRAVKVNELFTRIAPRYDLINDLQSFGLHRYWKRRLVSMARVKPGNRALDVCCGTGDLAFAFARRGAAVVGLDFSEQMLAVARNRQSKVQSPRSKVGNGESTVLSPQSTVHGPQSAVRSPQSTVHRRTPSGSSLQPTGKNPEFMLGDAQRLPFPEKSFDIVTVGYGLRNLVSWEAGLSEMARVARPGGRVLVLDFGKPANRAWRAMYFAYLRVFVPILGRVFCGSASAYAYILESLDPYPAQAGVKSAMRKMGLSGVRVVNLLGGVMSINYGERTL